MFQSIGTFQGLVASFDYRDLTEASKLGSVMICFALFRKTTLVAMTMINQRGQNLLAKKAINNYVAIV